MSVLRAPGGRDMARRRIPLNAVALGVVVVLAVLWLAALLRPAHDSGSLDSRVAAVGATVRCPICKEGIPLNDITNPQADQMKQLIRDELRQGMSEDGVRQYLADRYGRDILLAPPQAGFDALAWFVPLLVVVACAVALLRSIRRWSGAAASAADPAPPLDAVFTAGPPGSRQRAALDGAGKGDTRRYEELLDRELQRRG